MLQSENNIITARLVNLLFNRHVNTFNVMSCNFFSPKFLHVVANFYTESRLHGKMRMCSFLKDDKIKHGDMTFFILHYMYCKSLKYCVGFILRISRMKCFLEIKYHANILMVHCNNVTSAKSAKLDSNEIMFMGKTAKYKAFTVFPDNHVILIQSFISDGISPRSSCCTC